MTGEDGRSEDVQAEAIQGEAGALTVIGEALESSGITPRSGEGAQQEREIFSRLTTLQPKEVRLAVALTLFDTEKEAINAIGYHEDTPGKSWDLEGCRTLAQLIKAHPAQVARARLAQGVNEAVSVKLRGLRSADEGTRAKASTELIEWVLGKAPSKVEHGGRVVVEGYHQALVKVWGQEE